MTSSPPAALRFVHGLKPSLFSVGGVTVWYYGLAYSLGFLGLYLWLRWARRRLGWSLVEVYDLSIAFSIGALVGGRIFEIVVYEWSYYREHQEQLLSFWRGGMASHGVLLGGLLGMILFCVLRKKSFLLVADELTVPAAFFLALGRIGNFINGQIYGSVTELPWGVRFPGTAAFRHPVTLYESLKNLVTCGILMAVRRKARCGQGKLLAHFVLWYGLLRVVTDIFREYPEGWFLNIGPGQYFNLLMAVVGGVLLFVFTRRAGKGPAPKDAALAAAPPREVAPAWLWLRRVCFVAVLLFSLTIPSGWTQGVLPGLRGKEAGSKKPEAGREVPGKTKGEANK